MAQSFTSITLKCRRLCLPIRSPSRATQRPNSSRKCSRESSVSSALTVSRVCANSPSSSPDRVSKDVLLKYGWIYSWTRHWRCCFVVTLQVLDNKAPKAEDIDEEDDDVPGMMFWSVSFDQAVNGKMPISVILFSLHRSCRELRRGFKEWGKLIIGPSVTPVQDKVSCSIFKLGDRHIISTLSSETRDFYIMNWQFQIHPWPFSCIYTVRLMVTWL